MTAWIRCAFVWLGLTSVVLAEERLSFVNDVEPVLTRFGCNQGACHGKGVGQNGFKLSLRGYAPEQDHFWIAKEFAGRRVNLSVPGDSLLLKKASGRVPHAGGRVLPEDSKGYALLQQWLSQGTPKPADEERVIVRLDVSPGSQTVAVGATVPLQVTAVYSDGTSRDVSWLTQFASNDGGVMDVSPQGVVEAVRSGETAVRAHYQGQVGVVIFTSPFDRPPLVNVPAPANFVDEHVFRKLAALRIPPSPPSSDEQFLRRVFLDTIGTLPTAEEVTAFVSDTAPDKRKELIDALLARPEFTDHWTFWLADLLQNRKERDHDVRAAKGVRAFHHWLREKVAANTPWNELAREVLTASGSAAVNPQVGYYVYTVGEFRQPQQSDVVASVAQAFLGTRIGCAKCHNHPLERYTQDDYYHFAAFFSRVAFDRERPEKGDTVLVLATEHEQNQVRHRKNLEKQLGEEARKEADATKRAEREKGLREQIAGVDRELEKLRLAPAVVHQPRTSKPLSPQPLDRQPTTIPPGADPRETLADWITSPQNDAFSGAIVNRIWRHFLGVGLVEPVDDLRASNPPSNPELWKSLQQDFVAHGYDLQHLMRTILNSKTYQLSSATLPDNETDTHFYSHYTARRLPAEQLLDAISQVTGVPDRFPGYPEGLRAQQLPDPGLDSYFLSLFGRSERTTACACERQGDVNMSQLLHLLNGNTVTQKIASADGWLAAQLKSVSDNRQLAEAVFLRTVSRKPTAEELQTLERLLAQGHSRDEVFRDLLWALVNSKEFAFNH